MITYDDYVVALRADASALAAVAKVTPYETQVPSCPDWTVAHLVRHVGRVHRWATLCVAGRDPEVPVNPGGIESPPESADPVAWFEAGVPLLLDELNRAGARRPVWGWAGDHTSDFWARRQAHETSVHRIDAQLAAGAVLSAAPPELAADGIDEWFDVLVAATGIAARVTGTGETLHLHAIDTEGEWLFTRTPDGLVLERTHGKGDAAVRGPASDLFLLLMNRRSLDHTDGFGELEVFGDPAVVDNLRHDAAL